MEDLAANQTTHTSACASWNTRGRIVKVYITICCFPFEQGSSIFNHLINLNYQQRLTSAPQIHARTLASVLNWRMTTCATVHRVSKGKHVKVSSVSYILPWMLTSISLNRKYATFFLRTNVKCSNFNYNDSSERENQLTNEIWYCFTHF